MAPTVSLDSEPAPIGTVDNTATPGPEISTLLLYCEKVAHLLNSSTAATIITLA
ncbi:hypothetical protein D3C85_1861200 [compost metagenome]